MNSTYDVIIIGAGHNGLVAAAYLARAGRRVLVLERRSLVGGACVTEEVFPGFKVSTAAYVNSLFRKEIIADLRLPSYGFEMLERQPSSFTPTDDGHYLMLGHDEDFNRREIAKFSAKDAERYPRYEETLTRLADRLEPLMLTTPPDPTSGRLGDLWSLVRLARSLSGSGDDLARLVELFSESATRWLDRWFESEPLRATLATDAVIGTFSPPSHPGTAYVLFHHVMGETGGKRGVWGYVRGGMGALSEAIAAAARDLSVDIVCDAPVDHILVADGRATGVVLADGREIRAAVIASCADPRVTFTSLLDPAILPDDFRTAIEHIDYASASMKINVALSELPDFRARPGRDAGPQHHGTIHIAPTIDGIERAYDDAKWGRPSERPILECTIASVIDDSLAPAGQHVMSMFVQYAPYTLAEGSWDEMREPFADRCIDLLTEYAPNFRNAVIDRHILSPLDLERTFSLTGGNIFQGAMSPAQLFMFRPVAGACQYATPVDGLYLCGSAAHPGGGVIGAAGFNAARAILKQT